MWKWYKELLATEIVVLIRVRGGVSRVRSVDVERHVSAQLRIAQQKNSSVFTNEFLYSGS